MKKENREALIEVGLELLLSTGYTATGINRILSSANARSFYSYFDSKDEFAMEVIKFYAASQQARMERMMTAADLSPLQKLRQYFEQMIANHGYESGQTPGCLLGNLSLEVANQNEQIRDLLRRCFDEWQNAIALVIRDAIKSGELPRTAKANDLAAIIVDSWEGAQVRARAEQSNKALHLFFNSAFGVLLRPEGQLT